MGAPYHGLIPAAILLDNPGITREEFIKLLDETHAPVSVKKWYSVGKSEYEEYHGGLHGLGIILHLKKTDKFNEFNKPKYDENKLEIFPPRLNIIRNRKKGTWLPPKFRVGLHIENIVSNEIEEIEAPSFDKLKKGDVWTDPLLEYEQAIVVRILNESNFRDKENDDYFETIPQFKYKMQIRRFERKGIVQKFQSLEKLVQKYPEFHPDFMYDFSQEKGYLWVSPFAELKDFKWIKKDSKYYLDPITFNIIPIGIGCGGIGYTDLILTAEAIRLKAWKLISYCGKRYYLDSFLKKFPDAADRHARAVWDAYTSLAAKQKQMTTSEFLRWRLLK